MNTGAQKCVIQRVMNRTGVVVARSVGDARHRAAMNEVADVIERHDDHHAAAQRID